MKTITVFTPCYNRAFCLHQCYESLVNQTNQDFKWLIIDDGSTDETAELVSKWIKGDHIEIEYQYKDNGGVHTAYNLAFDLIKTELNVCIDSDDFMPLDAIESILTKWASVPDKSGIAGIIGLDCYKGSGKIVGTKFPDKLEKTNWEDVYNKHDVKGDKKLVYRTDVINEYPRYPVFEGEYFVPHSTLYMQIDKKYDLLCLNKVICIVEYLDDGYSRNIFAHYRRHPRGFQFARLSAMEYMSYPKIRFKNAVHYISTSIQLRDYGFLKKSPKKLMTIAALPFGLLVYGYMRYINRKL